MSTGRSTGTATGTSAGTSTGLVARRSRGRRGLVRSPLPLLAEGLVVEVDGRRVIDEVGLTVPAGAFVALTGASGAGKSTLLWALAGLLRPTSGSVSYAGRPVPLDAAAAEDGVLLVPQGTALVSTLTAMENVVVPMLVGGVRPTSARERATAVLGRLGLGEVTDHLVDELSGGQQQRVAVGRVVALAPSVLLADEPTSELDAGTRDVVIGLLTDEAAAGATVVLATHDPWCADQAEAEYHLDDGRLTRIR